MHFFSFFASTDTICLFFCFPLHFLLSSFFFVSTPPFLSSSSSLILHHEAVLAMEKKEREEKHSSTAKAECSAKVEGVEPKKQTNNR